MPAPFVRDWNIHGRISGQPNRVVRRFLFIFHFRVDDYAELGKTLLTRFGGHRIPADEKHRKLSFSPSLGVPRWYRGATGGGPFYFSPPMIYLCRNKRNGLVKIGFTTNPRNREKTLQSEEPDVFFERIYAGDLHQEQYLHRRFSDKRHRGEWFELDASDINFIDAIFGDDASRLRREILDEMAVAVSKLSADDLAPLLDQIRSVSANGGALCVGYASDMKALDALNDLKHDWIQHGSPISDEDALRVMRSIL